MEQESSNSRKLHDRIVRLISEYYGEEVSKRELVDIVHSLSFVTGEMVANLSRYLEIPVADVVEGVARTITDVGETMNNTSMLDLTTVDDYTQKTSPKAHTAPVIKAGDPNRKSKWQMN